MPCDDKSNDTTSYLPVTSLAILIAASFDSAPVVSSWTLLRLGGSVAVIRFARSTSGGAPKPLDRWSSAGTASRTGPAKGRGGGPGTRPLVAASKLTVTVPSAFLESYAPLRLV